jgi:hypothetical protein
MIHAMHKYLQAPTVTLALQIDSTVKQLIGLELIDEDLRNMLMTLPTNERIEQVQDSATDENFRQTIST